MKKLIAMIGAVATAFGLYAASSTNISFKTSFETADLKSGILNGFDGVDDDLSKANTNQYAVGEAYAYDETATVAGNVRRTEFTDGLAQNNYLKLETGTNVLTRAIDAGDVFADQLVKFTGFEEPQTNIAGKVAVWMTAIEQEGTPAVPAVGEPEIDNGEGQMIANPDYVAPVAASSNYVAADTNLYVTAATIASNGEATETVFAVDATGFKPEQWYRVTIQKIDNIFANDTQTMDPRFGFVVYVDGVAMTSEAAKNACAASLQNAMTDDAKALMAEGKLFPAITEGDTLATVGYQGIGAIDDLTLDNLGPEFARTIDFTFAPLANAEVTKVVDSKGRTLTPTEAGVYTAQAGVTLTATVTAKPGFFFVDKAGNKTLTLTLSNITPAAQITLDLGDYECVEAAVQVVNAGGTVTNLYAAAELNVLLTGLKTGDTATVLKSCAITQGEEEEMVTLYSFTKNTTIAVPEANVWNVFIANVDAENAGMLYDNVGVEAGKVVNVFFDAKIADDNVCTLAIFGEIAGDITAADNGIVYVNAEGNDGCTLSGTINAANIGVGGTVTFVGSAKIVSSATNLNEFMGDEPMFVADDGEVEVLGGDEGPWTAQIKGAPVTTGFAIIIAGEPVYFNTLQDAINAAGTTVDEVTYPAVVTIMAPATFDHYVEIAGKEITLDLNGQTLTYNGAADAHCAICIHNGAGLTINDSTEGKAGVLDGGDCMGAIQLTFKGDDSTNPAKLTVEAGKLVGQYYAVSGNGNRANTEVVINGGWLLGLTVDDSAGIYNPQQGKLTINGGKIEGATGVYIKAGVVECSIGSDAEIIAVGSKLPHQDAGSLKSTGDAIVVDNANYPGGVPNVEIKGGSFVSANGAAVASYAWAGKTPVTGFVTGGSFTGAVKIDDAIAGGTYAFGPFTPGEPQSLVEAVAKIGDVNYGSLQAAVTAADEGEKVTLLANTTLTETLEIVGSVEIDLNKKTVTFAANLAKGINAPNVDLLEIKNGTITVADGRTNIAYSRAIYLLHTSAVFTDLVIDLPGFEYVINKDCDLDPITKCWSETPAYTLDCENVVVNGNGSLFHIENAIATLTACATTFDTTLPSFGGAHEAAIYSSCGAVTTIDGGLFAAPNALQTGNLGGDIIVKNGLFNGDIMSFMYEGDERYEGNTATIKIEKGTFNGEFAFAQGQKGACTKECVTWNITGGKFQDNPSAYLNEGYEAQGPDEDGYYTVAQSKGPTVAKIGDVEYDSLKKAVDAAQDNDVIVMQSNYTLAADENVVFTKKVTLDLNDTTLTIRGAKGVFEIAATADVTLTNGDINWPNSAYGIQLKGAVTVTDCNITNLDPEEGNASGPVFDIYGTQAKATINSGDLYAYGDVFRLTKEENATPTVVINGGTFEAKNYGIFYAYKTGLEADITINAGTFESKVYHIDGAKVTVDQIFNNKLTDSCAAKFKANTDLANLCATGYEPLLGSDGYYMIGVPVAKIGDKAYGSLAAAVDATKDNDTITMLGNYTLAADENVVFTKKVTLDLNDTTLTIRGAKGVFEIAATADVTLTNGDINWPNSAYGIQLKGAVTVTDCNLSNGVYDEASGSGPVFDMYGTVAKAVVNSGNFYAYADIFRLTKEENATPTVVINGGNFAIGTHGGTVYGIFYAYKAGCQAAITINAGTFENDMFHGFSGNVEWTEDLLTDACQAKFKKTGDGLADYVAPGYAPLLGDDGYYMIQELPDITISPVENGTLETSVTNNVTPGTTVTVTATPATGFKVKAITVNGEDITEAKSFTMPAENVTVAATFEQDAQPIDPEQPKQSDDPEAEAAKMNNSDGTVKPEYLKIPEAAGTTPEAKAAYAALFTAVPGNDEVTIELNEAGTNALKTATAAIETAVANKLGDITAAAAGATLDFGTVTENIKPGFWYGVAVTTELGSMKTTNPATWVQATAEGVKLTATKPATGNAAFFQTKAKVTNK